MNITFFEGLSSARAYSLCKHEDLPVGNGTLPIGQLEEKKKTYIGKLCLVFF